jgi:hypothetical protein
MDCVGQSVTVLSEMLQVPVNACFIRVLKLRRLAGQGFEGGERKINHLQAITA